MSDEHLFLHPTNLDKRAWYYEEPGGLVLVIRRDTHTDLHTITWRKLRNMIKRKDKKSGGR